MTEQDDYQPDLTDQGQYRNAVRHYMEALQGFRDAADATPEVKDAMSYRLQAAREAMAAAGEKLSDEVRDVTYSSVVDVEWANPGDFEERSLEDQIAGAEKVAREYEEHRRRILGETEHIDPQG